MGYRKRMRNTALVLTFLLTASSALAFTAGCSKRRAVRKEKKEIAMLGDAAGVYWHSMRWSDYGTAAAFYPDQNYRMDWMNKMVTAPDMRYSAADVMRVEVSPELEDSDDGIAREGRVFVQVQGYRLPQQVMEQTMITQIWSRYGGGWYIDIEAETGEAPQEDAAETEEEAAEDQAGE